MPPQPIVAPDEFSQEVLVDLDGIRKINPQRFEMEQLSAITMIDADRKIIVGYQDVATDAFWVRGHMPDFPLMPGVMICEAAAQLITYYSRHVGLDSGDFIGFGGMNNIKFRGVVRPGDRLWLVATTDRHSTRRMIFTVQGFVNGAMVFNGELIGVPIDRPKSEN